MGKLQKAISPLTILCIALSILAVCLCLWHCSFGFSDDEPFYFTIPLRLIQGDGLIVDEWHVSQLSSVFLVPFVFLFRCITGGTEGIMVCARYVYVALHFLLCLFLFIRLKKYGYFAFFAALSAFMYSPHGVTTYCYNTLTTDFLILCFCLLIPPEGGQTVSRLGLIASGALFACAVLCCPYLAAAYFIFAAYVLISAGAAKKNGRASLFSLRELVFITVGIAVIALLFLLFLLGRTGINGIVNSLPYIFSDPEHPAMSLRERAASVFYSTWLCHPLFKFSLTAFVIVLAVLAVDRDRRKHWRAYLIVSVTICIFTYCIFFSGIREKYQNAIMLPLIFPGLTAYILTEHKPKRMFALFFTVGLIYSACLCFTSNLFFMVMPAGIAISNIASLTFISQLLRDRSDDCRPSVSVIPQVAVVLCVAALVFMQFYAKYEFSFYQSERNAELEYRICDGPAKGTLTDETKYKNYSDILSDITVLKDREGSVVYLSNQPWCYLYTDALRCGAYSPWLSGEDRVSLDRLETYWGTHSCPDYVYLPDCSEFDTDDVISRLTGYGYTITPLNFGILAAK